MLLTALLIILPWGNADESTARPRAPQAQLQTNVCSLLTSADMKRIQRADLKDAKASTLPARPGVDMRQCFYRANDPSDSISLLVAAPNALASKAAREYWDETLVKASRQPEPDTKTDPATKGEAKQKRRRPTAVPGLGDQAWWVGDRLTGALYVLQGDRFFRVSVGGKVDEAEKRKRSQLLAELILKRL